LPLGTPEEVTTESKRLLTEMAPGGGYIFSPSHSLTGDIPVADIRAFLDIVQNQVE
jgi:uroporphyrinogen decarboxylase